MRYVIDYPGWDFFSTLQTWSDRVFDAARNPDGVVPVYDKALNGSSHLSDQFMLMKTRGSVERQLFHMTCIGRCNGGSIVDVYDPAGLLDNVRKDAEASVELRPRNGDLEGSRIAGPYPVIRGDVFFDTMKARVCSSHNLEEIGASEKVVSFGNERVEVPVFGGGYGSGYGFTVKRIEEELSSRNSRTLGNWSLDDARRVADDFHAQGALERLSPEDAVLLKNDPLAFFCNRLEARVELAGRALGDRCERNGFLGNEVRDLLAKEQEVIARAEGLKGVKRSERYDGKVLGEASGITVLVKERLAGQEKLGNRRYLAFSDGHRAVSYHNAVRGGYVREPSKVIEEVMAAAERRDRNIRRFEKLCNAVTGRKEGRSAGRKV